VPERVAIALTFHNDDFAKLTCRRQTIETVELRLAALPPSKFLPTIECVAEAHRRLRTRLI